MAFVRAIFVSPRHLATVVDADSPDVSGTRHIEGRICAVVVHETMTASAIVVSPRYLAATVDAEGVGSTNGARAGSNSGIRNVESRVRTIAVYETMAKAANAIVVSPCYLASVVDAVGNGSSNGARNVESRIRAVAVHETMLGAASAIVVSPRYLTAVVDADGAVFLSGAWNVEGCICAVAVYETIAAGVIPVFTRHLAAVIDA